MSILWVAVLAIGASPLDGAASSKGDSASVSSASSLPPSVPLAISRTDAKATTTAEPAPRSGKELADAAHAALAHWAKAKGQDAQAAGRELLGIYRELLQDKKLAVSQRESLRMSVRSRLMQLVPQIKGAADGPKSIALAKGKATLAQQGVGPNGSGGFGGGNGAGGQNNNGDAGQELVDLIQNTISPKSWDVNGGNGSIYYWRLQHAIVVRATDDVHADISDALDQLNRAGH